MPVMRRPAPTGSVPSGMTARLTDEPGCFCSSDTLREASARSRARSETAIPRSPSVRGNVPWSAGYCAVLRRAEMPAINRRQAMVMSGAEVLPNPRGSAPGLFVTAGGRVVVLLPGPPRELEPMMTEHVRPRLAARAGGRLIRRRVLRIAAMPESAVDQLAAPVYTPWASADSPIDTTILASPGHVELHVSARGTDGAALDRSLDTAVQALVRVLGDAVFSTDGRALEQVVGETLAARGLTIALAESCTGGLIAGRLTDVAGSSVYVKGGVVAYANDVKARVLGVSADLIAGEGAVSEPVAAAIGGTLRGLLRSGLRVEAGLKIGDVDPRAVREHCYTISDKALAIAGGVLEAIFLCARRQAAESVIRSWRQLDSARSRVTSFEAQVKANEVALNGVRQEALVGSRTTLDSTRMTQWGTWTGRIETASGVIEPDGALGTKDRSWGVRPVGTPAGAAPTGAVPISTRRWRSDRRAWAAATWSRAARAPR